MSICPHCQVENEAGAAVCHTCGEAISPATAAADLPLWLQALKPTAPAEDTVVDAPQQSSAPHATSTPAINTSVSATPTSAASTPDTVATDPPLGPANAPAEAPDMPPTAHAEHPTATLQPAAHTDGADTILATQPTATARPVAPPATSSATTDTASLINEDDLPAWLRAFSEPARDSKAAVDEDQSWMVGPTTPETEEPTTNNLAQSWQAPAKTITAERASTRAMFAATESNPAKVVKAERLLIPSVPQRTEGQKTANAEALGAAPLDPAAVSPGTSPRLGSGRLNPTVPKRDNSAVQRVAIIAFLAALLIFLIVLGIFVVAPALRG